jgi:hypothetical protein
VAPPQTPDRERLSQIEADIRALPSVLAQLAYLAQLRDPNTGVYCKRQSNSIFPRVTAG